MEAAVAVISEKGFAKPGLRHRCPGWSGTRTFYLYFESKEALMVEMAKDSSKECNTASV